MFVIKGCFFLSYTVYGRNSAASPVGGNPVNSLNNYVPSHYQSVSPTTISDLFLPSFHVSTSGQESTGFDERMSLYSRSRRHHNEYTPHFNQVVQDHGDVPRFRHPSDNAVNVNRAGFGSHSRTQSQQGTGMVLHPSGMTLHPTTSSSEQDRRDESVNVRPTMFNNTGSHSRIQYQPGNTVAFYPRTSTSEQVVPPAARSPAPHDNTSGLSVNLDPAFFTSLSNSPTANRSPGHEGSSVPTHPLNFQGSSYSVHHSLHVDNSSQSQSPPSSLVPVPVISPVSHPQAFSHSHSVMSTQEASSSTGLLRVQARWDPHLPHPQPRRLYNPFLLQTESDRPPVNITAHGETSSSSVISIAPPARLSTRTQTTQAGSGLHFRPFVLQTETNRQPVNTTAHGETSGSSVISIAPPARLRTRTQRTDSLQVESGSSSATGSGRSGSTWIYDIDPIVVDDSSDSDDDVSVYILFTCTCNCTVYTCI